MHTGGSGQGRRPGVVRPRRGSIARAAVRLTLGPMSKPFDATGKDLIEASPADWLTFLGRPAGGRARLVDTDLSTVTTTADSLILVEDEPPWVLHLELQSNWDDTLPGRLPKYNVLIGERHDCAVATVLVLLREEANSPRLDGLWRRGDPLDGREHVFPYTVVRMWQTPVATVLAGGIATLPLVPLCDVTAEELPRLILRADERLRAEAPEAMVDRLRLATFILAGMRFDEAVTRRIVQELQMINVEESSFYQLVLERGRVKKAQNMVLRGGTKKFGPPDEATRAAIEAITDEEQLDRLHDRTYDVSSWAELLTPPG
jgi:predicted transposase YdaD